MIQILKKKSEKLHRLDLEQSLSQYTVSKDTSTQINKQTQYQICSNKDKVHKNQKENVSKDCNKTEPMMDDKNAFLGHFLFFIPNLG